MRDTLIKLIGYYDERTATYSDYSFILKVLPRKDHIKYDLAQLFKNFNVRKMIVIGSFDHVEKIGKDLKCLYEKKKVIVKQKKKLR
jgi:hypothetical protein